MCSSLLTPPTMELESIHGNYKSGEYMQPSSFNSYLHKPPIGHFLSNRFFKKKVPSQDVQLSSSLGSMDVTIFPVTIISCSNTIQHLQSKRKEGG
jgi:hypothetical protein